VTEQPVSATTGNTHRHNDNEVLLVVNEVALGLVLVDLHARDLNLLLHVWQCYGR